MMVEIPTSNVRMTKEEEELDMQRGRIGHERAMLTMVCVPQNETVYASRFTFQFCKRADDNEHHHLGCACRYTLAINANPLTQLASQSALMRCLSGGGEAAQEGPGRCRGDGDAVQPHCGAAALGHVPRRLGPGRAVGQVAGSDRGRVGCCGSCRQPGTAAGVPRCRDRADAGRRGRRDRAGAARARRRCVVPTRVLVLPSLTPNKQRRAQHAVAVAAAQAERAGGEQAESSPLASRAGGGGQPYLWRRANPSDQN